MSQKLNSLRKIPPVAILVTATPVLVAMAITFSLRDVSQAKQPEEMTKTLQVEKQFPETVQPALDINWMTTQLGTIPKKYKRIISLIFSPNGTRVDAVVAEQEFSSCYVIDGDSETEIYCLWSSSGFPHIFGEPIFSPDGRKLAYVAKKGKNFSVVMNGKEGKLYDRIDPLLFSPDSRKLAYVARERGKSFVVLDDEEGRPYGDIYGSRDAAPVFSPDSQKLAFVARKGGKEFVVIKDKDGEK